MKDLFKNYGRILAGLVGLLAFAPGFAVITFAVVMFVRMWLWFITWTWGLW